MTCQSKLDGKTIALLQQSEVIKNISVMAESSTIYVQYQLKNGEIGQAYTTSGKLKEWATIDAAVKWLKTLGIGHASVQFMKWQPKQGKLIIK